MQAPNTTPASQEAVWPEVNNFIHGLSPEDLSAEVAAQGKRCFLDLVGVAAGGLQTELSSIIRAHALEQFGAGGTGARLLFDGRLTSAAGAALAGGMTIDSFDAHDGHLLTKGHAGVAMLPALLAVADAEARDGRALDTGQLLSALVVGYEVSLRAGIALHETVSDYHTSGAWNALGAAAIGARLLKLDGQRTRHALGIAEYHGPRSQMMRCIDHSAMVKDGSGWGAMAGVSAAYLAAAGFTGAPALTCEDVGVSRHWHDLGQRWEILAQYFKPYPVCYWAQSPMAAVAGILERDPVTPDQIREITITTFHEAVRLAGAAPRNTEEAQYNIVFPLAALLCKGQVGAQEISDDGLRDPDVLELCRRTTLREDDHYNSVFPGQRLADVTLTLHDGRTLRSGTTSPPGHGEHALSDAQLSDKFHALADPVLGRQRSRDIAALVDTLDSPGESTETLLDLLLSPP